ncbi:DUF6090 family protein [Aliiglaciecola sp. CAU 1673]|uniref:DUF6090 family protein n=1 Tax=Aliiglaciecola sp. CAU 1673 TaxID=3032595 RepID=UPI0023DB6C48|nr:DUF6090 family protein [Aliiglaciecola sp. CAU 1673]MDF2178916.1 DUF6090 family protein [Aliiglaciecola sp. CAU 1673]
MLKESQSLRYFLYALGEIALVVVGILIALELDNWDKDKQNRKLEFQYYQSMKSELLQDRNLLLAEIQDGSEFLQRYEEARAIIIANDRQKAAELAAYASDLKSFSDFRQSSSAYQTLINSGEIKHIRNKTIIAGFQNLERLYSYIERLEDIHKQAVMDDIIIRVVEIIQFNPLSVEQPEALYSYQFNNIFYLVAGLIVEKNDVYNSAVKGIDGLIEELDRELTTDSQ